MFYSAVPQEHLDDTGEEIIPQYASKARRSWWSWIPNNITGSIHLVIVDNQPGQPRYRFRRFSLFPCLPHRYCEPAHSDAGYKHRNQKSS